jgi:hypothetical protein
MTIGIQEIRESCESEGEAGAAMEAMLTKQRIDV